MIAASGAEASILFRKSVGRVQFGSSGSRYSRPAGLGHGLLYANVADFSARAKKLIRLIRGGVLARRPEIGEHREFVIRLGICCICCSSVTRRRAGERIRSHSTAGLKRQRCSPCSRLVRATVKGGILVAMAQGTLGGIAFWFLGIHAALLWAVLMAFLSLIPAIGATLVWLPVAIYFLATGAIWQGVGLILYGVLVIGLVDNLLRPFLVGKGSKLPDYVVLISTLGGIEVFGLNGFVVGPLIAAMFMVSWEIFVVSRRTPGDDATGHPAPQDG